MTVGERISTRRKTLGLTQDELAAKMGYKSKAAISKIETNVNDITQSTIVKFAEVLDTSVAYLMGWETDTILPSNMEPLGKMGKIPLVGQIACGTPILAEENIEDYVDLPKHIKADYALTCKGNSMINAGIHDGDVVYIRRQERVDNGQIAAVIIDGDEATLKRFYYDGKVVTLVAENPSEPPRVFSGEDINRQRVVGLAVAFTSTVK